MKLSKRKIKKGLLLLWTMTILIALFISITLFIIGPELLLKDSNPRPSEAIIVLSGDHGRLEHAADLYKNGLADKVILSNSMEAGTTVEEAMNLGILKKDLIEEPRATSTYENALHTREIVKGQGFDSVVVVTSNYHSLRTKYTFHEVYSSHTSLTFSFTPSFYNPYNGMTHQEAGTAFKEYIKLFGYWTRFLFR